MQPLWQRVFDFCVTRIQAPIYREQRFKDLLDFTKMESVEQATTPGSFSDSVGENAAGETAFQRALYNHPSNSLVRGGVKTPLYWRDLELPIIFSKDPRRPSVDLIGQTPAHGNFLCELKYKKSVAEKDPAGLDADCAIFQALLYYGIVNRDHDMLVRQRVYHKNGKGFFWKDVSDRQVILVLANDYFWVNARCNPNIERIKGLVAEIRKLDIEVLLCSAPNYAFRPEDVIKGRYRPKLVDPSNGTSLEVSECQLIASFY